MMNWFQQSNMCVFPFVLYYLVLVRRPLVSTNWPLAVLKKRQKFLRRGLIVSKRSVAPFGQCCLPIRNFFERLSPKKYLTNIYAYFLAIKIFVLFRLIYVSCTFNKSSYFQASISLKDIKTFRWSWYKILW